MKIEWGTKRTCLSCSARFYDLQKTGAACPKCGTVFELVHPKGRRGKSLALDLSKTIDDVDLDLGADISVDVIEDTDDLDPNLEDIPDVLTDEGEE